MAKQLRLFREKLIINMTSRNFYSLVALGVLVLFGAGFLIVNALTPWDSTKTVWHDASDVKVTIGSDEMSLQDAINDGLLAGSIGDGDLDMQNNKIINLAAPTQDNDAATKGYVDAQAGGSGGCPSGMVFWHYGATGRCLIANKEYVVTAKVISNYDMYTKGYFKIDENGNSYIRAYLISSFGGGGRRSCDTGWIKWSRGKEAKCTLSGGYNEVGKVRADYNELYAAYSDTYDHSAFVLKSWLDF